MPPKRICPWSMSMRPRTVGKTTSGLWVGGEAGATGKGGGRADAVGLEEAAIEPGEAAEQVAEIGDEIGATAEAPRARRADERPQGARRLHDDLFRAREEPLDGRVLG